ncbi:MAG: hypothetical protein RLZZ28_923 [Bacteroidota bacterium]
MLIRNVSVVSATNPGLASILLKDGKFEEIQWVGTGDNTNPVSGSIELNGALAFPGLINSHDHLDFNLFPQLGNGIYKNYREWGNDIHSSRKSSIKEILRIPQALRIQWGIYKNLLNGFTTVVNHGDYLPPGNEWIDVIQTEISLHSVGFEKNWLWKLNKPRSPNKKIVIHTGEGTDQIAQSEIDSLIKGNWFTRALVGVHGVSMTEIQAKAFRALVWCPASNMFMFGTTAPVQQLKKHTKILFGSDSTLTAGWNIWEHLRIAEKLGYLTREELFASITSEAADVWNIKQAASIKKGYKADLVLAKRKDQLENLDAFFALEPADILLVVKKGEIVFFDNELCEQLKLAGLSMDSYAPFYLNKTLKYGKTVLIDLIAQIKLLKEDAQLPLNLSL